MKKLVFLLAILSLLFFVACSKLSDSSIANSGQEGSTNTPTGTTQVTRAFKGNFFTSIDPDPSNAPLVCSGDIPGFAIPGRLLLHGTAIHLGELIWQQSTLQHTSCNLSVSTMQLTVSVSGQLTASNGDRIFYTGSDIIDVSNLLTGQGTTGTIQGTWTITGGTGRFEGASGSFDINGPVDFATLAVSFEAVGTITY